jgi:hypothetical protein
VAKEDFCFTYYDGDAARDMAHMNRLERGGYGDIIVSQRKFGRLSLAFIKKTLGSDFDLIWEAIRVILKTDVEGNYYIEWLENSIQKMKRQSVKQSENGKKGGRPKADKNPTNNPNETQTQSQEKPLGNENGNEDENVNEGEERGVGEGEPFLIDATVFLPEITLEAAERNQFSLTGSKNTKFVIDQWGVFLSERIHDPPERKINYRKMSDLTSYFLNWVRNKHPKHGKAKQITAYQPGATTGEYKGL